MKQKIISILLTLTMLIALVPVAATTAFAETSGDYTFTVSDGKATVTGYSGSGGKVTIPSTLGTYTVAGIGAHAFFNCRGLTSITLPAGVKSIGDEAFYGCADLASVSIPTGVTGIGARAFAYCAKLSSLTVPNSVKSIGDGAFAGCTGLASVTLPDGLTTIVGSAFYGCSGLTSVTIPESVTDIGEYAFSDCTGLASVSMPEGLSSIGGSAFAGCTGLASVDIPESVTSIGEDAFNGCTGLASLTIPESVTVIEEYTFYGCAGLALVTLPDGLSAVGDGAFMDCAALSVVNYPGSEEKWAQILIGANNEPLKYATIVYNYGTPAHIHTFDKENTDSAYLKTPASCTAAAEYYYSCICGERGTESFTYGSPAGHTPGGWIIDLAADVGVDGSKHKECTVCHTVLETETIPALATDSKMIIGTKTARAGETVTIPFELAKTPEIKSVALSGFTYDSNALEYVSGEWKIEGSVISSWNPDKGTGVITFSANRDLNGVIFEATFKVKESVAEGEYNVYCDITAKQRIPSGETVVEIAPVAGGVKVVSVLRGDVDGDGDVTSDDAIYLLYYTLLPDMYPVNQGCDFNGDGDVTSDDAIYLLYFTLLPDLYPLN